jgi:hypothetical protein
LFELPGLLSLFARPPLGLSFKALNWKKGVCTGRFKHDVAIRDLLEASPLSPLAIAFEGSKKKIKGKAARLDFDVVASVHSHLWGNLWLNSTPTRSIIQSFNISLTKTVYFLVSNLKFDNARASSEIGQIDKSA